jgi:protein-S-isoprenylcysteine O-methyltransferase Ste14
VETVALVCWSLFGLLALALPIVLHERRTGATGFKWPRGGPLSAEWLAGAGLVASVVLGVAAPILAESDAVEAIDALDCPASHALGVALFAAGLVTVIATQQAMGRSWRIGVDPGEQTGLVTGGQFRIIRNPIFTGMMVTWTGLALMVPSAVALASVGLLIASLEVQTRFVEEPYLLSTHGERYASYARHVGRFVPRTGRLD